MKFNEEKICEMPIIIVIIIINIIIIIVIIIINYSLMKNFSSCLFSKKI